MAGLPCACRELGLGVPRLVLLVGLHRFMGGRAERNMTSGGRVEATWFQLVFGSQKRVAAAA